MRLLNTSTLTLTEFVGEQAPQYAILSHTWSDGEVLFQDLQEGGGPSTTKAGWSKVLAACRLAQAQSYSWIWIDTCCIDKSSSSELSEAINSMFKWYRDAKICFAYLADVPYSEPGTDECAAALAGSRWFTRGWTLQELLAPSSLDFYSSEWRRIASRPFLADGIQRTTGIDAAYLSGYSLKNASVAARMSWASGRETTRVEDMAYCLLGIFDVNLPLIYGEGKKAFRRLQEAILRQIDDQSLFAWGPIDEGNSSGVLDSRAYPLLADDPSWFRGSGDIVPFRPRGIETRLHVAHDGVTITSPLWKRNPSSWVKRPRSVYLAPLQCQKKNNVLNSIAIRLCSLADGDEGEGGVGNSPVPCYRFSLLLLTVPMTAWKKESLLSTFLYFNSRERLRAGGVMDRQGCVIRTLPRETQTREMFSPDLGLLETMTIIPFTKRLARSYGLGAPIVIRLASSLRRDLALVLQYQYMSMTNSDVDAAIFPPMPGWMINRVVVIPSGSTIKDVAIRCQEESEQWTPEFVRRVSGGKWDGQHVGDMSPTDSVQNSGLETFTRYRVRVSNEDVHGPLLFLVDVEDLEGENRSLEVHHGGSYVLARKSGI
ncbi:HET domain-containing protein [Colletotrichum higginsianum]|uniref:HET domain-containing protein n=2 Tax=Colletotrichum higginsianum TaxID=80884 RepID=H1VLP8_COLHI|nr:HET domain-containing protein [Colletotrichum higginsianum IMI 349063]OBR09587.1 HET domain-containing protein [Colletotrichum higginsianum IMI 349063]TIC95376.1 Vegetative incompatibility protein HET-E-1 [Colletotrichum higginsianum]CCF41151.1 HET domain-containing protein [Colletotrichum higginsianum]